MRRLIIAANRLPFNIQSGPEGLSYQPSPGGLATALTPLRERYQAAWVGFNGLERPLKKRELTALGLPEYAHPIDIPADTYQRYYHAVANGSLWPTLHGFKPAQNYSKADWRAYEKVNQLFAKRIANLVGDNDLIWIHDFHLFLLPKMLRQAGLKNRIGFFLHVPVADAELLNGLPNWPQIQSGLEGADVLGVQTERDALGCIEAFRKVPPELTLTSFPIGINYRAYQQAPSLATVKRYAPDITKLVGSKKLVLSVSRLDYTKGILEQLNAIGAYKDARPNANILFKLIVAPSREAMPEYQELKRDVEKLVEHINYRHPGTVAYEYHNVSFEEMNAWYTHADVMLVLSLIDGMNLIAKEYVAAHPGDGVLILGKNAGAAQQLQDALLVDPVDTRVCAKAIGIALNMPDSERHERFETMRRNVRDQDVFGWAADFLSALD